MASKKTKVITICSSASFYKQVLDIEKELKRLGFTVKIPKTANIMKRTGNFDVSTYKTWFDDPKAYIKKKQLMDLHFKKVMEADAILVVNGEKHGLKGYIGGNVLMEMTLAYYHKKKIYIWNEIDAKAPLKEEILGVFPVFINRNLAEIK